MHVQGLGEMSKYAAEVLSGVEPQEKATVFLLQGDLGSGKTTFVQSLGEHLGVDESITSPTFVIQKEYPVKHEVFDRLVHIDAYRFEESGEAHVLGLEEVFVDPKALVCIEWPSRIGDVLPQDARTFSFKYVDESSREIIDGQ